MADASAVPETTPAATVVLVRDTAGGLEVLMLRRGSTAAFGGMWVFPGGRVDEADDDPAAPGDELAAARRAAVREAQEEASLDLAGVPLTPLSHWIPPAGAPRRYATWFFLAPDPGGGDIVVDGGEIHEHAWIRPADAMTQRDEGVIELAPPTWVTLHWLRECLSVDEAIARAGAAEPERYETRIGHGASALITLWHGDAGYDDADASRTGARHRLVMSAERWQYERTTAGSG